MGLFGGRGGVGLVWGGVVWAGTVWGGAGMACISRISQQMFEGSGATPTRTPRPRIRAAARGSSGFDAPEWSYDGLDPNRVSRNHTNLSRRQERLKVVETVGVA